jgi:hypothetical protein
MGGRLAIGRKGGDLSIYDMRSFCSAKIVRAYCTVVRANVEPNAMPNTSSLVKCDQYESRKQGQKTQLRHFPPSWLEMRKKNKESS